MPRGAGLIRRVPITATVAPDSSGWTTFSPSVDTNIIYVSDSIGNDGTGVVNDINHPFKTLSSAKAQLTNGKPDWLLLKKGDTWTNQNFGSLGKSGRSSSEPMVIGSYDPTQPGVVNPTIVGGSRPLIIANATLIDTASSADANNVAIVGLEVKPTTENSYYGFHWVGPGFTSIFFEDCYIHHFQNNLSVEQGCTNFTMRRCTIADAYNTSGHSEGLYIDNTTNPVFFQNFWDHNGWNAGVGGAEGTIFNRNLYIEQSCGKSSVIEDIYTNSSCEGMQLRSGGTLQNCLFVKNPIGFDVGHQLDGDGAPAIHEASVTNNVVLEGNDITNAGLGADADRCDGVKILQAQASGAGITVDNNIVANFTAGTGVFNSLGYLIDGNCSGVHLTNNIFYNWPVDAGSIVDNGSGSTLSGNDDDSGALNTFNSSTRPHEPFPAPTRSVGSYMGTLGETATLAQFITRRKAMHKDNWNTNYLSAAVNIYIRAGFGR